MYLFADFMPRNMLKPYTSNNYENGFTLVEMLVSLVLSAIIFVSAYQVISNLIQYQVRFTEKSEKQLDSLLVRGLVDQIVSKGLHQNDLFFRAQNQSLFEGENNSIRIVSRAFSDHYDLPGYRVYRVYAKEGELYVSYIRYDKESLSITPFEQTSGIKIENIVFEYLDNDRWIDRWPKNDRLPLKIRVRISMPGQQDLVWISRTGSA